MADQMKATPRSPILGLFSDIVNLPLQYMSAPERTQQSQGVAQFLYNTGIPKTLERASYGESLFSGAGGLGGTTRMRPETADALVNVAPFLPKGIRATKDMPVGLSIKDIGELQKKYPNVIIDAYVGKNDINLSRIVVPKEMRNQGIGTQVMNDISEYADSIGKRITLTPSSDFGGSVPKLKSFYKELGFVENKGKNKDFSTRETMYREPKPIDAPLPYPQQAALDLAQQRAALPVSEGGLGLPPNNTAMDRAKAMGFDTPSLHGSGNPNINVFDPNLVGTKAGNAFDNYMWFTSSPESASGYSLNTDQFSLLPEVKILNAKINQVGKDISNAYSNKKMDEMGDLRKELSNLMKQKSDIYKNFELGQYVSEGSTVYPVFLKSNEFMPYEASGQSWMKVNRPAIEESQASGLQGVEIRNVKDNPNPSINNIVANTYATENPDLIRSRFAAFDPFRKDVATATAMGVALPDLLAQPIAPPQPDYETTPMYFDPFGNTIGSSIR